MDMHTPHLIVAQILVRESQQRHPEEQIRDHLRGPEGAHPTWTDQVRLAIGGALVTAGKRLAGMPPSSPVVATASDGKLRAT
jgi:hypothetical protein